MLTVLIIQLAVSKSYCFALTERMSQERDQNIFPAEYIHHLVIIEEKIPSQSKLIQKVRELDEDQLTQHSILVRRVPNLRTRSRDIRVWGKLGKGSVNIYPTSFGVKNG